MPDKYMKILEDLQKDLQAVRDEHRDLVEQREMINDGIVEKENRIKKLEQTIISVAGLCNIEPPVLSGFSAPLAVWGSSLLGQYSRFTLSNQVRGVLGTASSPLTAI